VTLKAALVGTGRIAHQHLACLRQQPDVQVAAVCDLSAVAAEAAAERHGVSNWFTDHLEMLRTVHPDVLHVTTPPASHFGLAMDGLDAGAHVVVEKPAAATFGEVAALVDRAGQLSRAVVEDYNYVFNRPVRTLLDLIRSGEAGALCHVAVTLCLDLGGSDSPYADPNLAHPALQLRGGAVADFLPHLASLTHAFVGPHRGVSTSWAGPAGTAGLPHDEMRALVEGEGPTATICFSGRARPDVFEVSVLTTRMRARADLFHPRLVVDGVRRAPRPLVALLNALNEAWVVASSAVADSWAKLGSGPGSYEGLWELLARTYVALGSAAPPPVTLSDVLAVNRLVRDLVADVDER
jgi:predicted dehydrogenase